MDKDNSNGKNNGKRGRIENLVNFKPGQSGNPKGYPKGKKNFKTLMREAIEKIANANGQTVDELEAKIFQVGFKKALSGDYKFYQDYMDRTHDKPVQKHDVDVDLVFKIDEAHKQKTKAALARRNNRGNSR